MTVSGIGGSAPSQLPPELAAAAPVAQPGGASSGFPAGLFAPGAGGSPEDSAALLTLAQLQAGEAANDGANKINALFQQFATAIGQLNGSAKRRATLAAENADLQHDITDLQAQQMVSEDQLATAQADLKSDQSLDPRDPKKEAEDQAKIYAILATIDGQKQAITQDKNRIVSNTKEITGLQTTFLFGLTAIATSIVRGIAEQAQAQDGTVIAAVENIYRDLKIFLDEAQKAKDDHLVQARVAIADDIDAKHSDGRAEAIRTVDAIAARPSETAPVSPLNNLAVPNAGAPTALDQSPQASSVPAIDATLAVQIPVQAPADDLDDQAAEDAEQAEEIADEARIADDNARGDRRAVAPAPVEQAPQAPPINPPANANANGNDTEKALRNSIAADTVDRRESNTVADARSADSRAALARADELLANLGRFVKRHVKPPAGLSDHVVAGSRPSDLESPPRRFKIPV